MVRVWLAVLLCSCGRLTFDRVDSDGANTSGDAIPMVQCTAATCPSPGTCVNDTCRFDCDLFNCDAVVCPAGMPCEVNCLDSPVNPTCYKAIDCSAATSCVVT